MHRTTHHLEHEDPGIIKRQKETGITNGEPTPYARKKHLVPFILVTVAVLNSVLQKQFMIKIQFLVVF